MFHLDLTSSDKDQYSQWCNHASKHPSCDATVHPSFYFVVQPCILAFILRCNRISKRCFLWCNRTSMLTSCTKSLVISGWAFPFGISFEWVSSFKTMPVLLFWSSGTKEVKPDFEMLRKTFLPNQRQRQNLKMGDDSDGCCWAYAFVRK